MSKKAEKTIFDISKPQEIQFTHKSNINILWEAHVCHLLLSIRLGQIQRTRFPTGFHEIIWLCQTVNKLKWKNHQNSNHMTTFFHCAASMCPQREYNLLQSHVMTLGRLKRLLKRAQTQYTVFYHCLAETDARQRPGPAQASCTQMLLRGHGCTCTSIFFLVT